MTETNEFLKCDRATWLNLGEAIIRTEGQDVNSLVTFIRCARRRTRAGSSAGTLQRWAQLLFALGCGDLEIRGEK